MAGSKNKLLARMQMLLAVNAERTISPRTSAPMHTESLPSSRIGMPTTAVILSSRAKIPERLQHGILRFDRQRCGYFSFVASQRQLGKYQQVDALLCCCLE
jgi:hypothetical protein